VNALTILPSSWKRRAWSVKVCLLTQVWRKARLNEGDVSL